ncbi:MAG: DUF192 domain-containing protein [bacterium]
MKPKITATIILLIILCIVFFCIYIKFYKEEITSVSINNQIYETVCGKYKKGEIIIGSKTLLVDIADDNCKKDLGLSGKTSLNQEGMIFIFEKVGNYGFWMKDMNFSIDILWINDVFEVIGIEKSLSSDTYPKSFGGKYLAKYILEVSAGYSDKNNIKIGDKIIFSEK